MKVNDWFNSDCNYMEGVMLYQQQKGHSSNLLRLFLRKESVPNFEKLKYELSKFKESESSAVTKPKKVNLHVDFLEKNSKQQTVSINSTKPPSGYFYKLNELHTDLHPLAMKQRNDFQKAISLKLRLNNMHPDEEGESLKLCIQIEDLFDAIETAQKVLDHYVEHKVVLNIEARTYNDYTGGQLADARRNKRTSVTKFKNKINTLKTALKSKLPLAEKTKLENQLQKDTEKLLKHELDLQELNELINTPK